MVDIVIPLGSGSTWDNNELRYCLRSIEKHLNNFRNVYIVGECPDWIRNVIHIPARDDHHASKNILRKILAAIAHPEISQEFLFMNDDHFLLQDVDAPSYPHYFDGHLFYHLNTNIGNWYHSYVEETMMELARLGLPENNYDIHTPIRYDRTKFLAMAGKYDFNKKLIIKSMYCNTYADQLDIQKLTDCKIRGWRGAAAVEQDVAGRHVFSIGDQCMADAPTRESGVKVFLKNRFPDKSKFEA